MEIATIEIDGATWRVDFSEGTAISARIHFDAPHPRAFGLEPAHAEPIEFEGGRADTDSGGLWNAETITLTPHGNGTHTECIGHLVGDAPPVPEFVPDGPVAGTLATVEPETLGETNETYAGECGDDDSVLTAVRLEEAVEAASPEEEAFLTALVVRTEPNSPDKRHRDYTGTNPPYPTAEAVAWCVEAGVEHLLVDLPSLDREEDDGELSNHRTFWDLAPADDGNATAASARPATITEMIYAPSSLDDGAYALNLQTPDLEIDAAPSRPILYPLERS